MVIKSLLHAQCKWDPYRSKPRRISFFSLEFLPPPTLSYPSKNGIQLEKVNRKLPVGKETRPGKLNPSL